MGITRQKIVLAQSSTKRSTFVFAGESEYTLGSRRKIAHKGTHGETGVFRMGALSLPSDRFAWFGNPAWPGLKTADFAALGSWPGMLQKNAESLRDSDALMRVAVPRRRGPAGLRNTLFNLPMLHFLRSAHGIFACARWRRYHYPRCTPHIVETPGAHLSKRLIFYFLDLTDYSLIPAVQKVDEKVKAGRFAHNPEHRPAGTQL